MALMTPVVGVAADALVARGVRVGTVRKSAQAVAFLGPAACNLTLAALTPADGGAVCEPHVQCSAGSH
jgi:ACS family sodium-dependent inorganic phosphate cotransporter